MNTKIGILLILLVLITGCSVGNKQTEVPEVTPEVAETAEPEKQSWGLLPQTEEVPDSYFDDAVMIGDSRMQGLYEFDLLPDTTVLAARSLSIRDLSVKKVIEQDGVKKTVMEALAETDCNKIYICFGFNELGYSYPEVFAKKFAEAIDQIRELKPEVPVVVLTLFPVSEAHQEKKDEFENVERINEYNDLILDMARQKQTYIVDVREAVMDEKGYLKEEYTEDGTHLDTEGMKVWLHWLKTHALEGETE